MSVKERKESVIPTTTKTLDEDNKEEEEVKNESLYVQFTKNNKKIWLTFNGITTLLSIGLAIGTFMVNYYAEKDCGGIKLALWLVFSLHVVNTFETFLNLVGLEKKLCTGFWVCVFLVYESVVIIFMQVVYFRAMDTKQVELVEDVEVEKTCLGSTTLLYLWLMGQILIFYGGIVVVVCYFFRQHC